MIMSKKIILPIIFAITGLALLLNTFATSNTNSVFFEAESASGIAKTTDSTASNNSFIGFTPPSSGGTSGGTTSGGTLPSWIDPAKVQRIYIQCLTSQDFASLTQAQKL